MVYSMMYIMHTVCDFLLFQSRAYFLGATGGFVGLNYSERSSRSEAQSSQLQLQVGDVVTVQSLHNGWTYGTKTGFLGQDWEGGEW